MKRERSIFSFFVPLWKSCFFASYRFPPPPKKNINKAEEYLNAACMIEPKGFYYLFGAYIKYDYFERKFLNTSPDYKELLQQSIDAGCTQNDKERLFAILGVECPHQLY